MSVRSPLDAALRTGPESVGSEHARAAANRNWVLALLLAVYVCNFIDRTILSVLQQPIMEELHLSDWQLGLLSGPSFALFYAVLGLPIARLAEFHNRSTIICIALALWSGMTALCGLASSYAQLFLFRVGVGVGEAGCTPPAQSLISDYFEARKRTTAMAVYSLGVPMGILLGATLGGFIAERFGWRAAFFFAGVPGLLLAVAVKLTIREPQRGASDAKQVLSASEITPGIRDVCRSMWTNLALRHLTIGSVLASLGGYGIAAFSATYFMRAFELGPARAGLIAGIASGLSCGIGTLLGGILTDRVGHRDSRWYAWLPAVGLVLAVPLYLLSFWQMELSWAAALLAAPGVFHYLYLGPTYGVLHNLVSARERATASALLILLMSLIGLGIGPPLVGVLSDAVAHSAFTAGEYSTMCLTHGVSGAVAGGLAQSCRIASAHGLRVGLSCCVLVFLWAALHYYLAGHALARSPRIRGAA